MPQDGKRLKRRRVQIFFGLSIAAILYFELEFNADHEPIIHRGTPVVLAAERIEADPFERLVRHDPLAALREARDRLTREQRDYACTFVKQERMASGISAEQELQIKFRPVPYSVVMHWIRNPGLARRAIYVKGRWRDESATDPDLRELAVCQPGEVASLFVKSIKQPIHGTMAKRSSRRTIDQFGFERALDLLIHYCDLAAATNELRLDYKGESYFDGRPVWVIRRHLPYSADSTTYPDRTADIYIDKEYQVPVALYCYSDDERTPQNLLGKYEYRNVQFDAGFSDKDFEPATYGM